MFLKVSLLQWDQIMLKENIVIWCLQQEKCPKTVSSCRAMWGVGKNLVKNSWDLTISHTLILRMDNELVKHASILILPALLLLLETTPWICIHSLKCSHQVSQIGVEMCQISTFVCPVLQSVHCKIKRK